MKRRPHWKFFCPKTPCSHLNGCVEESRVVPPWTKASERYVSFHLSIIVIIVFLISWIYATFPLSMSFSLRERIGGVRSKIVLEISTELHVSASSSPWKWPHGVLRQKNFQLGLRSVMSITYFSFFYYFFFKYYYFINDLTFFLPFSIRSDPRSDLSSDPSSVIRSGPIQILSTPSLLFQPKKINCANFFFQTLIFPNYTPPLFPNKESSSWSGKPSY